MDLYGYCPTVHSSAAIGEEGARALRGTAVRERLDSDDGYSIGRRRGDRAKEFAATSRSFQSNSNVLDANELHLEKQDLHNTLTDDQTSIVVKSLSRNADSSIRCIVECDSNIIDANELQLGEHNVPSTSTDDGI
jgi:hypothetical protein